MIVFLSGDEKEILKSLPSQNVVDGKWIPLILDHGFTRWGP